MKIQQIIFAVILGFTVAACHDLSLEPKGQLGEAEIFGNEYGVQKYFTRLYMYLPIEDFNYYANSGYRAGNYWESYKNSLGQSCDELVNTWTKVQNNGTSYWPYDRIREVNTFIVNFPKYKDNYTVAAYNNLLGEARFLRAFFYFGIVKRYGGIPLVTEVQDPTEPLETLQPPRATEYDSWKFIQEDLQFAMDNMTDDPGKKYPGRANKYTAAALMSRTMLYAGCIAKYTQYLGFQGEEAYDKGFAGIAPDKANEFFQYA
ncbi:MAG: RagB/SusD family nutrient uptake outer membrane protein, partial [Dysgonamonadaceae bacterium]|nr:RagB/SusD family nutrient uptake outer membrane protein [Dysgonamonadaceae bacterium]